MKIKEIEISKVKELKEKSMMLKDERQKGKVIYKKYDIISSKWSKRKNENKRNRNIKIKRVKGKIKDVKR